MAGRTGGSSSNVPRVKAAGCSTQTEGSPASHSYCTASVLHSSLASALGGRSSPITRPAPSLIGGSSAASGCRKRRRAPDVPSCSSRRCSIACGHPSPPAGRRCPPPTCSSQLQLPAPAGGNGTAAWLSGHQGGCPTRCAAGRGDGISGLGVPLAQAVGVWSAGPAASVKAQKQPGGQPSNYSCEASATRPAHQRLPSNSARRPAPPHRTPVSTLTLATSW